RSIVPSGVGGEQRRPAGGGRHRNPRVYLSRRSRGPDGHGGVHLLGGRHDRDPSRGEAAGDVPARQSLRQDDGHRAHPQSRLRAQERSMMATRAHGLDERGMATVMALIVVLALSLLVAAFLAVSAFEPQISQNLTDSIQAHYVADPGLEWAYDQLVATPSWNPLLTGSAGCLWVTPKGWDKPLIPGFAGPNVPNLDYDLTFTVEVRNACGLNDNQITGVPLDQIAGP